MSSAHKKVIVRRHLGDTLPGYLPLSGFVRPRSNPLTLDLLDLAGRVLPLALADIKHIAYVRDFNLNDSANPERLTRKTFLARPRTEGLWLRLTYKNPNERTSTVAEVEVLEGLASIDQTLFDDALNDAGLFLTPPDIRSNTQRLYIPRSAIAELQLLAVITTPSRTRPLPAVSVPSLQEDLFDSLPTPNTRPN